MAGDIDTAAARSALEQARRSVTQIGADVATLGDGGYNPALDRVTSGLVTVRDKLDAAYRAVGGET